MKKTDVDYPQDKFVFFNIDMDGEVVQECIDFDQGFYIDGEVGLQPISVPLMNKDSIYVPMGSLLADHIKRIETPYIVLVDTPIRNDAGENPQVTPAETDQSSYVAGAIPKMTFPTPQKIVTPPAHCLAIVGSWILGKTLYTRYLFPHIRDMRFDCYEAMQSGERKHVIWLIQARGYYRALAPFVEGLVKTVIGWLQFKSGG